MMRMDDAQLDDQGDVKNKIRELEEAFTRAKHNNDTSQVRNIVNDQGLNGTYFNSCNSFSSDRNGFLSHDGQNGTNFNCCNSFPSDSDRNGFFSYDDRNCSNSAEGCNSQQIDRNGFYSYESRNGFSSSHNGVFPNQGRNGHLQGHIGYHQGRNGYAQTFNNPSTACRQNYGNQPNYNYSGFNVHKEHAWAAANEHINSNSFISGCEEPKPRPPIFTGKGDWKSLLLQFEMLADRYNWCIDRKREEINFCLKDEALSFVTQLSVEVRSEWIYLIESMNRRFGDHTLPETHRRELQQIRKAYGESFLEYSTRIEAKMSKTYPGMQNTEIYKSLSIEHMLNGIHDQSIAYDVLTKRPQTSQEAVNLLSWHFSCKNGIIAKQHIRQTAVEHEPSTSEIKRVGNTGKHFVTEDRLVQFGGS